MNINGDSLENQDFDFYRSRLRILFIIYFFSKPYKNEDEPNRIKIFETEVRIQKIDFLIRNPDYLSYEILSLVKEGKIKDKDDVKHIIENIFNNNEPEIRKQEMERFFFGAFEDLDDVIAFLKAYSFIEFESEKSTSGTIVGKKYFVTKYGEEKIKKGIAGFSCFLWYVERCEIIFRFFGNLSGNELKIRQYQIQKYRETPLNQYIDGIERETKVMFQEIYGDSLA